MCYKLAHCEIFSLIRTFTAGKMLSALKDIPPGHLALGAAACFLLYQVYLYLTLGLARRKFIQQNGCRPPPAYPHKDPILGLDWALKGMKYSRSRTFLQGTQKRFREHGNTHSLNVIGKPEKVFFNRCSARESSQQMGLSGSIPAQCCGPILSVLKLQI
ncbi:hypothetical protein CIHG_07742 [Coccidioides immitis H538.4]|uniref:Uncharacterized protein n=1 Tax=Coccidioides immitis H538.4 TaxID=396776 RepID=A0A0J8UR42_COCIT|nr:hypothetical protein CIHG_07742 [Coccidioides immitis H538.4]